ncbi:MAG: cobyric acid synthase [Lachnospiraceae bacterium]|nr:cobyric acid synthase [Lachnospiraceae bacterium]
MAKSIMLQGTMSGAGKSLMTAALCRILKQDGYRVAPFKSQNMALNSYVTDEGLEIGRAQAMQAEAAGVKPSVWMNPILLKPTSDMGSQVVVNGRVFASMRAVDYFRKKKEMLPVIQSAYERLAAEYDIVVIEGAGSPVELNLLKDDIVNMGMARIADAPVLLVGNIDQGGIFAQMLGTLMLLEEENRARVKGLIVNKFRGDARLFEDGVQILQEKGGVSVLGVVPYLPCDIEEEDSLAERIENQDMPTEDKIDLAVIRLPRMSNFTDFDVFRQYDRAAVRYVKKVAQLGNPDMILVPGTKNTLADLRWMKESGMEGAVKKSAAKGIPVFGICGGYQMMGRKVSDPDGVEEGGSLAGFGFFDFETVFSGGKVTKQSSGSFAREVTGILRGLSGKDWEGYEIHHGRMVCSGELPECGGEGMEFTSSGGFCRGNLYGCYIHGIFDAPGVADAVLMALGERKGQTMEQEGKRRQAKAHPLSRAQYKEEQYDLLAAAVRANIDMERLYEILGL